MRLRPTVAMLSVTVSLALGVCLKAPAGGAPGQGKQNCVTSQCHQQVVKLSRLHGPVGAGECTACHSRHTAQNRSRAVAQGSALCFRCHDAKEINLDKATSKHAALVNGCAACHDPHGGGDAHFLRQEGNLLCGSCHSGVNKTHAEKPSAKAACTSCHDPHGSKHRRLLRRPAAEKSCPRPASRQSAKT